VVYNLTERALIEEIRKSTEEQIVAKEKEIEAISSRMIEIDRELSLLYSSNITLSSEQIAARERLLVMQRSFREELSLLNEERSHILEISRAREARLRSQLEERTREFTVVEQRVTGELETAVSELERLSNEHERILAIDAHFAGGIATINDLVQRSQYDQALRSVANLREFVNNNTITLSRSFQSRREYYNQTINLLEAMLTETRRNSGSTDNTEQLNLITRNTELQNTISEMQRTIDSFSSGRSGQAGRISELEGTISTLRNTNTTLEQNSTEKDRTIASLQNERATLSTQVAELNSANSASQLEITRLRNQLAAITQALQDQ
jgi:chromosome segregation ATPase